MLVFHTSLYWDGSPVNLLQEDLRGSKPQRTAYTLIIQDYSPGPVRAGMLQDTRTHIHTHGGLFPLYKRTKIWIQM